MHQRAYLFKILLFLLSLMGPSFAFAIDQPQPRNFLLPPLFSFLLPGFDQYVQGEWLPGLGYSGMAIAGLGLHYSVPENKRTFDDFGTKDNDVRLAALGSQMYQTAGSYSLFHSFKEVLKTRTDDFLFLKGNKETVVDILSAPFRFQYLTRPTTFIPLLILSGFIATAAIHEEGTYVVSPSLSDWGFTGGFAYFAGTGENAVFQGWMMPVFMQWTGSGFWSNTITAGLFAAAHLPRVSFPLIQFASGWYDGWLVQRSGWTIAETVFQHVWWDVIAFASNYAIQDRTVPLFLKLPPVFLRF